MAATNKTFREKAEDVCYQRQVRDAYSSPAPDAATRDGALSRARVRSVSYDLAKRIILRYEWLGTMGPGCGHHYGIFFSIHCAGVVSFGVGSGGANLNAHKEFNVERDELAYLARGACVHWAPTGTNSKLVAHACRLLHNDTGAQLVIAYADEDAGEIGTIYQACNFTYIGRGSATRQWIAPNGRIYDQKHPANLRARQHNVFPRSTYVELLRSKGWTEQVSTPKHRYVYILDRSNRALVECVDAMREAYPKRSR